MSTQAVSLTDFLAGAAGSGPVVGVVADRVTTAVFLDALTADLPDGFELRVADGNMLRTRDQIYTEFARIWEFPSHFGRNADAFDECMRDLDQPHTDSAGTTPSGYITVITDAQRMLPGADSTLAWLVESFDFYREHYRDIAEATATFAVILVPLATDRAQVIARWTRAGSTPAEITR